MRDITQIPFKLVESHLADTSQMQPGEAFVVDNGNGTLGLVLCCPACGKVSSSAGKHTYNPATKTVTPSIVHNKLLGGCGWHGYLENGKFRNA